MRGCLYRSRVTHLAAGIPYRRDMEVVPEGRPIVLVVEQAHSRGPISRQPVPQLLHLRRIRPRALQEPAVPAHHRFPADRSKGLGTCADLANSACMELIGTLLITSAKDGPTSLETTCRLHPVYCKLQHGMQSLLTTHAETHRAVNMLSVKAREESNHTTDMTVL